MASSWAITPVFRLRRWTQACWCLWKFPCPASRIAVLTTSVAKFYAYLRCRNAIWYRATSIIWSRRASRRSASIAACWATSCCGFPALHRPKAVWSWKKSKRRCLLLLSSSCGSARLGAQEHHVVAMHQFGIRHAAQDVSNALAGLSHDAPGVGGRIIDQAAPALYAVLVHTGDDIAPVKLALNGNHADGQQASMALSQCAHCPRIQRYAAAQAQVVGQPPL